MRSDYNRYICYNINIIHIHVYSLSDKKSTYEYSVAVRGAFEVKAQINISVSPDVIYRSKSIDFNANLF